MTSSRDDFIDLLDFAFERLRDRLHGLADEEWTWQPTGDVGITLRWRLEHIASFLGEDRNPAWLGVDVEPWPESPTGESAADALTLLDGSFAHFRGLPRVMTAMLAVMNLPPPTTPPPAAPGPAMAPGRRGPLRLVGNILWFVLAGLWMGAAYLLAGAIQCVTIIGIPFGIQSFKLAG